MMMKGRAWVVGNRVSVTDLVPARYDKAGMSRDWAECSRHVLEDKLPGATNLIQPGDILIGGTDFGVGHAHYYMTAIMGCVTAGFSALFADSVNTLFLRAAVDAGVTVWAFPGLSEQVQQGDELAVDLESGIVKNLTSGSTLQYDPVSPIVLEILRAGGSEPWALNSVRAASPSDA
jgi:3-isopropylmalate/(R)-2-methylmalate dehydratase small subunit